MIIELTTKAQNLNNLKDKLKYSKILPLYIFSVRDWIKNKHIVLQEIQRRFSVVVIRSSSVYEDTNILTNAGKYHSELNVDAQNTTMLSVSIQAVIDSYGVDNHYYDNEILVQPMLSQVKSSGVAFTYDIENNLPYYVITTDSSSFQTNTVTGGLTNNVQVRRVLRGSECFLTNDHLLLALVELEQLTGKKHLDIEFAIDDNDVVYLLQVRPLILKNEPCNLAQVHNMLFNVNNNSFHNTKLNDRLNGNTIIYSNMVDWNPAELTGKHPAPLDFSLYNTIFTNKVWSLGRKMLGYKDIGQVNLIQLFFGYPYVNVLYDFNSYLPAGLDSDLEDKLIDYYINYLKSHGELHDKAEFSVVDTCYSVDFDKERYLTAINSDELALFEDQLIKLTNNIILDKNGVIDKAIQGFIYEASNDTVELTDGNSIQRALDRIINTYSIYYSIIVRSAFVCYKQFLGLMKCKLISQEEFSNFFNSISTITSEQISALAGCDTENDNHFLQQYICIKQNMFNINYDSPYLDESFIEFAKENNIKESIYRKNSHFELFRHDNKINKAFTNANLNFNLSWLCQVTKQAFYYREQIKYIISKKLYQIFDCLKIYSRRMGLDYHYLSYVPIDALIKYWDDQEKLNTIISKNSLKYIEEEKILLPDMITCPQEFYAYKELISKPNFVTTKTVEADLFYLHSNESLDYYGLKNKIILVCQADPGFDWLFNCGIAGLITEYGGIASHMALRAYELSIPAVIGCGSILFSKLKNAKKVYVNCKTKQIIADGMNIFSQDLS